MSQGNYPQLSAGWKTVPLKHAVSINPEVLPDGTPPETLLSYVDIAALENGVAELAPTEVTFASAPSRARRVLRDGDTILSTVRTYLKAVASFPKVEANLIASTGFAVLRPNGNLHPRFAYWAALSEPFIENVVAHSDGVSYPAINPTLLGNLPVAVPPPSKQERIANFLDDKTAWIDALIAEKIELAKAVEELRESVISDSVTLSNVLGWRQTRLKYLVRDIIDTEHKTVPFQDNGEYLVARTTNIKKGRLVLDGAKYTDMAGFDEWTKRAKPSPGDILFTREAPAGEACLVPEDVSLCLGQRTVLIRLRKDLAHAPFVLWSLYGGLASKFISDLSQGSTVAHFNMPDIGNIPLFTGPLEGQSRRADELEIKLRQMDDLSAHIQDHISHLREYRSSLISAAVTGQMDLGATEAAA